MAQFTKIGGPQSEQVGSGLFQLPTELRTEIYKLVFSTTVAHVAYELRTPIFQDYEKQFAALDESNYQAARKTQKPCAILLACKQTHHEAIRMYYHTTTFEFRCPFQMRAWMRAIGEEREHLLRHVRIYKWPERTPYVFDAHPYNWALLGDAHALKMALSRLVEHEFPSRAHMSKVQINMWLDRGTMIWTKDPMTSEAVWRIVRGLQKQGMNEARAARVLEVMQSESGCGETNMPESVSEELKMDLKNVRDMVEDDLKTEWVDKIRKVQFPY